MKQKNYQEPTIHIVKLQQMTNLLSESGGVQAQRSGYGTATSTTWGDEE